MPTKARSAVLITKNHKVLLIERIKTSESKYYVLPGGGIKKGETPEQAAIREIKEELGVDITIEGKEDPIQGDRTTWIVRAILAKEAEPIWQEEYKQTSSNGYKVVWFPIAKLNNVTVFPKEVVKLLSKRS